MFEEEIRLRAKFLSITAITAIILGLLFISNHHLGYSFGDDLFRWAGIPPWTREGDNGVHLSAIAGLILLVAGILWVTRIYRPRYPKIMSRVLMGCVAWIIVFPFVSESVMYVVNFNSSGMATVAYSRKDSRCDYWLENEAVLARCQIQVYSYGTEGQVTLRPVGIEVGGVTIDFKPKEVMVRPRSKIRINETFEGLWEQPNSITSMSGATNDPDIELTVGGRSKQVK